MLVFKYELIKLNIRDIFKVIPLLDNGDPDSLYAFFGEFFFDFYFTLILVLLEDSNLLFILLLKLQRIPTTFFGKLAT